MARIRNLVSFFLMCTRAILFVVHLLIVLFAARHRVGIAKDGWKLVSYQRQAVELTTALL